MNRTFAPTTFGRKPDVDFDHARRFAWSYGEAYPRHEGPGVSLNYPVPDPCSSEEEFARFHHRDLAAMARSQLHTEAARLRLFLLVTHRADAWHFERLRAIQECLRHAV